ncbi:MAG: hypothetical protein P4L85_24080 [Paludisphaera borealis]|uniref:hypothetical protein n=1 Tax=Paludisphaera borealis TaxID=1387353 RepID=UPI00284FB511|nr:hypothetical protein [Paludisphaera borealis]MDR3622451.1 hypothetical protein [Paludisphaera borealis]
MFLIARVGTWKDSGKAAMGVASTPVARRIILAAGVAAGGYACRGDIESGTAALGRAFASTGSIPSSLYENAAADWADGNPHAAVRSMFRYPPKLALAMQRIMDDDSFDFNVEAVARNGKEAEKVLNEAWRRVANPGERLTVEWETTAHDGGKSVKLIGMETTQYANSIMALCCHIQERLDVNGRAGVLLNVARGDSLPRGDYDLVGAASFAPIGGEGE